jgi:hypothetical protein
MRDFMSWFAEIDFAAQQKPPISLPAVLGARANETLKDVR